MIDALIESISRAAGDLSRLPELIPETERLHDAVGTYLFEFHDEILRSLEEEINHGRPSSVIRRLSPLRET